MPFARSLSTPALRQVQGEQGEFQGEQGESLRASQLGDAGRAGMCGSDHSRRHCGLGEGEPDNPPQTKTGTAPIKTGTAVESVRAPATIWLAAERAAFAGVD